MASGRKVSNSLHALPYSHPYILFDSYKLNFDIICRGFSKDFDPCVEELVTATLHIYNQAIVTLLPTPAKSHCKLRITFMIPFKSKDFDVLFLRFI